MSNQEGFPPAAARGERHTHAYVPYPLVPATMTLWLDRGARLGDMVRRLADYARGSGRSGSPSPGM